jgi:hypothetical protein
VSVAVKVVEEVAEKLPPTRYVPAGRVGEVTMVVAPFPIVAVVEVFKTVGGANALMDVGATTYMVLEAVAICRERCFLFAVFTNAA